MRILLQSHKHGLFPFAFRLKNEGHEVVATTTRKRYLKAWGGDWLNPIMQGEEEGDFDHTISDVVKNDEADYRTLATEYPRSPVRLGAWFDGEGWLDRHLCVYDYGAWPGGLGPMVPAAMTAVSLSSETTIEYLSEALNLSAVADQLKSERFRGPVQVGCAVSETGLKAEGLAAGFFPLHVHSLVHSLDAFGHMLDGLDHQTYQKRYTVVLPVTMPPFPYPPLRQIEPGQHDILGLTPKQLGKFFWHDVQVRPEEKSLATGGLDGFVGVARGAAESLELARGTALGLASAVQLPQKQFRYDVGGLVPTVLQQLESSLDLIP